MYSMSDPVEAELRGPVETALVEADVPATITTTLYDLIAAIHTAVALDDDPLVVAIVVHILRSRRVTLLGDPEHLTRWAQEPSQGCANGLPSLCDAGSVPRDDGHRDNGRRPKQEWRVSDQGIHHIAHLRVRTQWREESEVPLKWPVEPAAKEVISGRETGQPHDTRGIAKRIQHDYQTGAAIAERHEASQQQSSWHAALSSGARG
jgi:hypothetical protein